MSSFLLESEFHAKLELPHATRRTRRIVVFDVVDHARVTAAIHAGIALATVEAKDGVIEHVVSVKAELRSVPLGDGEGF